MWLRFFDAWGIGIPEAEASAIPIADASELIKHLCTIVVAQLGYGRSCSIN